jgi:hypothetical protein
MFAKARNQRFENGCPFRKNTLIDDQVKFLLGLLSNLKVTPQIEKDNIKAFKEMCEAFEKE